MINKKQNSKLCSPTNFSMIQIGCYRATCALYVIPCILSLILSLRNLILCINTFFLRWKFDFSQQPTVMLDIYQDNWRPRLIPLVIFIKLKVALSPKANLINKDEFTKMAKSQEARLPSSVLDLRDNVCSGCGWHIGIAQLLFIETLSQSFQSRKIFCAHEEKKIK